MTGAAGTSYGYDANGNQVTRGGQAVTWMSYNYPKRINLASGQYHEFSYDAGRARWKQLYVNGGATETTITVADLLEKRTSGSVTEYRHTIRVGDRAVALYTRPSSGAVTTEYFLLDHLGSVDAITGSSGNVVVSESFSAFGERRDPDSWSGAPDTADLAAIAGATPRGYTFHTNLEASPLIHMNGRVMDASLGRFLSADPYVPDPLLTQGFNRYGYVNNNPLSFTDPSGFVPCFEVISCGGTVIGTVFSFAKSLFGKKKQPPPKGCFLAAVGCYGQAGLGPVPGFNPLMPGEHDYPFPGVDADTDRHVPGLFRVLVSSVLDTIPGVGQVKGVIQAVAGRDLITGEEVNRAAELAGIVPGVKHVRAATRIAETVKTAARSAPKSWAAARKAYWKQYGPGGKPPTREVLVRDTRTGQVYRHTETKELHHIDPQRLGGTHDPTNLREAWPTEHAALDPHRHPGYEVIKVFAE